MGTREELVVGNTDGYIDGALVGADVFIEGCCVGYLLGKVEGVKVGPVVMIVGDSDV